MVDFAKLIKELEARTVKIHALYECSKCGCIQRFVQVMPNDWPCYTGTCHGPEYRRGKLRLLCRIIVPKGHANYD